MNAFHQVGFYFVMLLTYLLHPWCQGSTTVLHTEKFEAYRHYDASQYSVTISRVQQMALDKASGPVPLPANQLELANAKKDKEPRS